MTNMNSTIAWCANIQSHNKTAETPSLESKLVNCLLSFLIYYSKCTQLNHIWVS